MKLLFATTNQGKLIEAQKILTYHTIVTLGQIRTRTNSDLEQEDVVETGSTFKENSFIKAEHFADLAKMTTFADDSGLEVTALSNQPGVDSHRWVEGSDHYRNLALLKRVVNKNDRSARFVTIVCLYHPATNQAAFFRGEIQGKIAKKEKGEGGFGYDSIFIPNGYDRTFGELGVDVKNKLSHRFIALKKLNKFLG
ncbi:MAG: RdgB/HAM1 family non-canonical purine NTP pyrophosphatase [Patescibacteria group bacterium]|nr:RdgB/HAM1 family non-canonical purine NTP pyrophosphatase [Patescibacteria group bacterium]